MTSVRLIKKRTPVLLIVEYILSQHTCTSGGRGGSGRIGDSDGTGRLLSAWSAYTKEIRNLKANNKRMNVTFMDFTL